MLGSSRCPVRSHVWAYALACAAALMVLQAAAVAAGPDETWKAGAQTCFAREYDRKHLAAHPRQRLTSFALGPSRWQPLAQPGSFAVVFRFRLKGDRNVYETGAICRQASSTSQCSVEADGGSFTMRTDDKGLLINITRMEVEGDLDFGPDLAQGGDDSTIRLFAAPMDFCRWQ